MSKIKPPYRESMPNSTPRYQHEDNAFWFNTELSAWHEKKPSEKKPYLKKGLAARTKKYFRAMNDSMACSERRIIK